MINKNEWTNVDRTLFSPINLCNLSQGSGIAVHRDAIQASKVVRAVVLGHNKFDVLSDLWLLNEGS
jgi:hypothetical protein